MRFSTTRVYQLRHSNIAGQSRIRTSEIPKGYRVYSAALSASQPTAQTRIVKDLAEGRRLERLSPEGPWLSRPVGYQLPEPSGAKLQLGFRGNYRLGERHQECPTKSGSGRRPRLRQCRI